MTPVPIPVPSSCYACGGWGSMTLRTGTDLLYNQLGPVTDKNRPDSRGTAGSIRTENGLNGVALPNYSEGLSSPVSSVSTSAASGAGASGAVLVVAAVLVEAFGVPT